MLKLKKEKILVSLIAIVMIALVVGNVYSLATEDNNEGSGSLTLTNTSKNNTANTSNKATNNAENNTAGNIGADVGATNKDNKANNTTNNTTNNVVNNTNSSRNNTNKNAATTGLPYAGSNSSIIFIVIALGVSAVYAYKKVSDYNV